MNIFMHELRSNIKSLLLWSVGMVFLVMAGMTKYSGFKETGASVNKLFEALPPLMAEVFGLSGLDLTSLSQYYGVFFLYFVLMCGTHAVMLGATVIIKEERDRTADYLYSKPVVRGRVVAAKLLAALVNIMALNVVTCVSSILFVGIVNDGQSLNDRILIEMIALFFIQAIFLSIGAAVSSVARNAKMSAGIGGGIFMFTFVLSVAIDLNKDLEFLKVVTPFKYFRADDMMHSVEIQPSSVILSVAICAVLVAATLSLSRRRDLQS